MKAAVEWDSEAYPENILRMEMLAEGTSVLSVYNSKHEQTAQSYITLLQTMKGAHA